MDIASLEFFAAALGWTVVVEVSASRVRELHGASAHEFDEGLLAHCAARLGAPDGLHEAIRAARRGQHAEVGAGRGRLLVVPAGGGRAAVAAAFRRGLSPHETHEVTNALASVIGWADAAIERPEHVAAPRALGQVARAARWARAITRVGLGKEDSRPTEVFTLEEVAYEVVGMLEATAHQRAVELAIDGDSRAAVEGTHAALLSAVWNLTKNAIEVSPAGGRVLLSPRLRGPHALLEVHDQGPGMDAETQRRIFDDGFTTRRGGHGLGLRIVSNAVVDLGGRVSVRSELGRGSTFIVELPSTDADPGPDSDRITVPPRALPGDPLRLLLAEDDAALRELLATTLSLDGFVVEPTMHVEAALGLVDSLQIAVIDRHLGDDRGEDLLAALRQAGFRGPALMMTGGEPPAAERGTNVRWLRKPFSPGELRRQLRELLSGA